MAGMIAVFLFFFERTEIIVGGRAFPYVLLASIGLSVVFVGVFNDKFKSNITVPIGIFGWIVTFCLLYYHYSGKY